MTAIIRQAYMLSSRPVEAALGILVTLIAIWMMAFDWFGSYFHALRPMAGMEYMISLPLILYGIFQTIVSVKNIYLARLVCCLISGFLFFTLMTASIYENGFVGPHVPGFGLCIWCHLWAWFKMVGVIPGGHD